MHLELGSIPDWLIVLGVVGGYIFNALCTIALYKLSSWFATKKQAATLQDEIEKLEKHHEVRIRAMEDALNAGGRAFGRIEGEINVLKTQLQGQPDGHALTRQIDELSGRVKSVELALPGMERSFERTLTLALKPIEQQLAMLLQHELKAS